VCGWKDEVAPKLKVLGQKDSVKAMLKKVDVAEPKKVSLPASVDLRAWCSPIENQGSLGLCTAHASVGVVEYFERRTFGKHIDASRFSLYKVTLNMLHWTGDTGAFLFAVMTFVPNVRFVAQLLTLFSVPGAEFIGNLVAAWPRTGYLAGTLPRVAPSLLQRVLTILCPTATHLASQ